MARTVLLVRHGKAEKAREGLADTNRSLTPEGTAALAEAFPQTFALVKDITEPPALWTSPAKRARQTTEQVIAGLKANGVAAGAIELHESLWHQDPDAFLAELAATADDSTVIAVGHIPFMESMLERLSGASISFAPGGVAAVQLTGDVLAAAPGRLLWFMQGPKVR